MRCHIFIIAKSKTNTTKSNVCSPQGLSSFCYNFRATQHLRPTVWHHSQNIFVEANIVSCFNTNEKKPNVYYLPLRDFTATGTLWLRMFLIKPFRTCPNWPWPSLSDVKTRLAFVISHGPDWTCSYRCGSASSLLRTWGKKILIFYYQTRSLCTISSCI